MSKVIILFFLSIVSSNIPIITYSQNREFELDGNIKGVSRGKIEIRELLIDSDLQVSSQKVLINDGKFKFKEKILFPSKVSFKINDSLHTSYVFLARHCFSNLYIDW